MPATDTQNQDTMLAQLAVSQGLVTDKEVSRCRALLEKLPEAKRQRANLGQMLVEQGMMTRTQLDRLTPQLEKDKDQQQIPGFQILNKLGAGAMATVYLARQVSLDRKVAIKVLPKRYLNSPDFIKRFYDEGRAAAQLNHPNIVAALDVGQAGNHHYFAMEYVEGHTVYDDLTRIGRYPEKRALEIVLEVAKALEHAHKQGFIHRDVKPKNIMIMAENGVAKLADMGLARAVSDREAAEQEKGKAFGTPYYISPEQIRGQVDVDYRADIYGLGATFYHMVTGKVPFDAPNPSQVMHRHLKDDLIPPDQINPDLSRGLCEIVEVMMAKDPAERYSSCTDLIADVKSVLQGEPPLQARKKFDLGQFMELEKTSETNAPVSMDPMDQSPPLTEQPMFWVAIGGWLVAGVLVIIVLILLMQVG